MELKKVMQSANTSYVTGRNFTHITGWTPQRNLVSCIVLIELSLLSEKHESLATRVLMKAKSLTFN